MRYLALAIMLLLSACVTSPISFSGTVPPERPDSYTCAVQQLNLLGYTLEDANREAAFARGRKQTSGLGTVLLTGKNYHDVLTVSAFTNPTTNESTLRVTAARMEEQALGLFGGQQRGIAPSDSGKADANAVLAQCGAVNVRQGQE